MTTFLNNIFNKRDKPISENSEKLYTRNLEKLNDNKPVTDLKFLKNIKEVLSKIQKYKPTTQRSFIIAICTVLKNNDDKLYNQYYEILSKMNNDLKVNVDKSDKQNKNWIESDKIDEIYGNLQSAVTNKSKTGAKESYDSLLHYMILSLYVLIPPRRNLDYVLLVISSDMSDKKFNYLDFTKKQLIFNNYKTQGTYESIILDSPDELFKVIKSYMLKHPHKAKLNNKKYHIHFLVNFYGEEIDKSTQMTKILNSIFGGLKIGSSMLRNMYLTNKYSGMMKELKSDVKDMSTSVDVALNNYIKKD